MHAFLEQLSSTEEMVARLHEVVMDNFSAFDGWDTMGMPFCALIIQFHPQEAIQALPVKRREASARRILFLLGCGKSTREGDSLIGYDSDQTKFVLHGVFSK